MRTRPRFLPSDLDPRARRVYGAVVVFFLVTVVALVWPVYPVFGDIRPLVLGMPFSLVYVVAWLVGAFCVLLGLFVWESRRRRDGGRRAGAEDAGGGDRDRSVEG